MTGTTEAPPAAPAEGPPGPPPPAGTAAGRRRRGAVLFPVVVVAVIVVTIGACLVRTRDDGADTPEQALDQLVTAIESGDPLAVLDALPPAERAAVAEDLPVLAGRLADLGLLDVTGSGPVVPTLAMEDLRVSTTPYGEGVTAVDLVGGRLTATLGPGGGPLTEAGVALLADPDAPDPSGDDAMTITRDLAQEPIRLIAIREGGGWHISLGYSVVDALVADGGSPVPEMGAGPFPYGAATAEAAVTDLVKAYSDGFVDRMITVLASDEARSLYDYAPAIAPGTSQLVDDLRAMGARDVQLNAVTTSVSGTGDVRTVRITGLDLDVRDQVHKTHLVLEDGCLHVDQRIDDEDEPYAVHDVCAGEWDDPDATARPLDDPVGNAAVFGGGAELPAFTVVERNGRWFVSPVRTLLDATLDTLDGLDPDQQRAFLERLVRSGRAGVGDGLIGQPLAPDLTPEARASELIARCDALVPDDLAPPPAADGAADPAAAPGGTGAAPADPAAPTPAEAVRQDCVERLVRTGSIAWDAISPDRRATVPPPA